MLTSSCVGLSWAFATLAVLRAFVIILGMIRKPHEKIVLDAVLVAVYAGIAGFFAELSWFVCPL